NAGVDRPSDELVELELVHLLVVADRHPRRMDENRHLAVLRPFPERKGIVAVDEAAVPARADQQALEAERREAALALDDVAIFERVERAQTPIARRARDDTSDAIVDRLADVERRRLGYGGHHLDRERRRND